MVWLAAILAMLLLGFVKALFITIDAIMARRNNEPAVTVFYPTL